MVDPTKPIKPVGLRRRMVLQLVFALVIFLSGTVIGTGGTMQWLKSRGGRIGPPRRGRGPDPNTLVAHWTKDYGLSLEQGEEIRLVLKRADALRRESFQEMQDKMEAAFKEMIEGLKEVMTPDQFAGWHEEFQKRQQKYQGSREGRRRDGRGGGPGGPRDEGDPNRDGPRGERDFNRGRQRGPRPPEHEEPPSP